MVSGKSKVGTTASAWDSTSNGRGRIIAWRTPACKHQEIARHEKKRRCNSCLFCGLPCCCGEKVARFMICRVDSSGSCSFVFVAAVGGIPLRFEICVFVLLRCGSAAQSRFVISCVTVVELLLVSRFAVLLWWSCVRFVICLVIVVELLFVYFVICYVVVVDFLVILCV